MPGADRAAYFLRTQRRVRRPACVPTEDSFVDLNPLGGDGANRQDGCFDLRIQTNLRPLFPESTLSFGALAYRALGHTPRRAISLTETSPRRHSSSARTQSTIEVPLL